MFTEYLYAQYRIPAGTYPDAIRVDDLVGLVPDHRFRMADQGLSRSVKRLIAAPGSIPMRNINRASLKHSSGEYTLLEDCFLKTFRTGMVLLAFICPTPAWSAVGDELWKMTTKTEMTGMPMPEVTQSVCLPKGEAYKPGNIPHQKHCKLTDIKVLGDKTTWHIHCSGREAMDGNGEMIRAVNTMKGRMTLNSENITMTMVFSGKLIGTCQAK